MDPAPAFFDPSGPRTTSAALSAVMRENQLWLAAIQKEAEAIDPTRPSRSRIGIEGPGFLALDDGGRRAFSRAADIRMGGDGRLLDDRGRALLGFPPAQRQAGASLYPVPLEVPQEDAARSIRCEVDEEGRVWGIARDPGVENGPGRRIELGRLALAVFESPGHLRGPDDGLVASAASGAPMYLPAGAPHLGRVRRNPQIPSPDEVRANLLALWNLSGHAETDVAIAASADALERTALNLVR